MLGLETIVALHRRLAGVVGSRPGRTCHWSSYVRCMERGCLLIFALFARCVKPLQYLLLRTSHLHVYFQQATGSGVPFAITMSQLARFNVISLNCESLQSRVYFITPSMYKLECLTCKCKSWIDNASILIQAFNIILTVVPLQTSHQSL